MTPAEAGAEHEERLGRLARLAAQTGAGGILLAGHHNIAWLTGGAANRIDASREAGSARLLVTADGRRFLLANAIEMPRLVDEELAGLGYEPIEYSWTDDQDPAHAVRAARARIASGAPLAADWPLPDTTPIEASLARTRALLTDGEIARYRALGAEAGRLMARICRELSPGDDERDIAGLLVDGAAAMRARAIVALVGCDDRLRRYRHPVPTATKWRHVVMLALCAERHGLVVSLSRIVVSGAPEAGLVCVAIVFEYPVRRFVARPTRVGQFPGTPATSTVAVRDCASMTATAAMFTISCTSAPCSNTWTAWRIPMRIGPMAVAPPSLLSSLYAMFPALKFGNINTLAGSFKSLNG